MSADRLREAFKQKSKLYHRTMAYQSSASAHAGITFEDCMEVECVTARATLAASDAPAPVNVDYGDHDSILMASNAIAEQWARLTPDSQKRMEIRKILRLFFPTITREQKTGGPVSAEQPPAAVAEGEEK